MLSFRYVLSTSAVLLAVLLFLNPQVASATSKKSVQTRHNEISQDPWYRSVHPRAEKLEIEYGQVIYATAEEDNLDEVLIIALILAESDGNHKAHNKKSGAKGLGQIKLNAQKEAGCKNISSGPRNIACMGKVLKGLRDKEKIVGLHNTVLAYYLGPTGAREATEEDPWRPFVDPYVVRVVQTLMMLQGI